MEITKKVDVTIAIRDNDKTSCSDLCDYNECGCDWCVRYNLDREYINTAYKQCLGYTSGYYKRCPQCIEEFGNGDN